MSGFFKWGDTTIIMIATFGIIVGEFLEAFNNKIYILFISAVLKLLWSAITTISRSAITKLMESNEVGKAFSVLGVLGALFPVITKPFYSYLYKTTLETLPGAFYVLSASLYVLVFCLLIYTHTGMKKLGKIMMEHEKTKEGEMSLNCNEQKT